MFSQSRLVSFALVSSLAYASHTQADPVNPQHQIFLKDNISSDVSFVAITQTAFSENIHPDLTMSFDALIANQSHNSIWTLYIEGSTSQQPNSVSTVLPDANADAGSTLNQNENGDIQVSELHYTYIEPTFMTVTGLIDATGFLDISEVANDETGHFINSHLVNNPSIEFPDYTLGFAYHYESINQKPGMTLLLAGSHGLADNTNSSLSELFDVNAEGKGNFIAAEIYNTYESSGIRGGFWLNNADHETFTTNKTDASNYGWFATTDFHLESGIINIRFGRANDKVSEISDFFSVAYIRPDGLNHSGLGLTYSKVSDKLQQLDNSLDDQYQFEAYSRFQLNRHWHITPSLQLIYNNDFNRSSTDYEPDVFVASIRATWSQ